MGSPPYQRSRLRPYVSFSVPLCYVYPPILHYKACARTRREKAADIALMTFGVVAAVYTTAQTIKVGVTTVGRIPIAHRAPHCSSCLSPRLVGQRLGTVNCLTQACQRTRVDSATPILPTFAKIRFPLYRHVP